VIYRVSDYSGGSATLDATYKGDATSAANFLLYQDEYDLAADCLKPLSFLYRDVPSGEVEMINERQMQTDYWGPRTAQTFPYRCSVIRWGTDVQTVRFSNPLVSAGTVEYKYAERPSDLTFDSVAGTDTPQVPQEFRSILANDAAFSILTDKGEGGDVRAQTALGLARKSLSQMRAYFSPLRKPRLRPGRGGTLAPNSRRGYGPYGRYGRYWRR